MDDDKPIDLEGQVVHLPVAPKAIRQRDDVPFQLIVNRTGRYCAHTSKTIDDKLRSVKCNACGAPLDAFDVLFKFASEYDRFDGSLKRLKVDVRAAEARRELLKRLENNARARVKKLMGLGSREHYDSLLQYVRTSLKRPEYEESDVERVLDRRTPRDFLGAAQRAVDAGHLGAAVALIRRAADELEAGVETVKEERKHG